MREKKLTKKQREILRSHKWLVFERSIVECTSRISELRQTEGITMESKMRLRRLDRRIRDAFHKESFALGWTKHEIAFNSRKSRTRLSIEA